MERHHIHGCEDYDTKKPKAPREVLKKKWGLDIKGGTSGAVTSTAAGSTGHNSISNHPNRQPLSTSSNNNSSNSNSRCGDDTSINRSDENNKPPVPSPTLVTTTPRSPPCDTS
jgi:hypothetical protein